MRCVLLLACAVALSVLPARAMNAAWLGYTEDGTTIGDGRDFVVHHDGSFENAYAWQYGGAVAPYYGAFGEAYDAGYGDTICQAAYWVSAGYFVGQTADCYVWESGIGSSPGAVLGVVADVVFSNVPDWPACGENDVTLCIYLGGPFTVGYWGNWPDALCGYYCAADLNGPGGHPWTCIAPGIGYPSGWQDPSIVFGPTRSMGIGVDLIQIGGLCCYSPAESPTWGSIKAMFR